MHTILVVVHLFLAIGVIGLVLMQHGKGADAGAAFGSGASGTVFGARGSANFLSRSTAILATLFFVTSLALAWFAMKATDRGGLMDKVQAPAPVAVEKPDVAIPPIPGIGAPESKPSAVPAIPEGKPAEGAAVPVENPAVKAEPASETQVEAAAQPAMQGEAQEKARTSAAESKATEQVPTKAE